MRVVGFKAYNIGWDLREPGQRALLRIRVVPHHGPDCEQNEGWNRLATTFSSRTIVARNATRTGETAMTSRIEPYRVSAYNTSKHSENKMHDDTVAKRYGFSGGVGVRVYVVRL